MDLCHLLAGIQELTLSLSLRTGLLRLETLAPVLEYFYLNDDTFDGSVCLTRPPVTLRSCSVTRNRLSGSLDLTNLSEGMVQVFLLNNNFSGETDFQPLPPLHWLDVSHNFELSGEVHVFNGQSLQVFNSKVKDFGDSPYSDRTYCEGKFPPRTAFLFLTVLFRVPVRFL